MNVYLKTKNEWKLFENLDKDSQEFKKRNIEIGDGVVFGDNVRIGCDVVIHYNVEICDNAVICDGSVIGNRVWMGGIEIKAESNLFE